MDPVVQERCHVSMAAGSRSCDFLGECRHGRSGEAVAVPARVAAVTDGNADDPGRRRRRRHLHRHRPRATGSEGEQQVVVTKVSEHAARPVRRRGPGHPQGLRTGRRRARRHRRGVPRHDGRHQHGDRARRRAGRHDHDARLPRHPAHGAPQAAAQFLAAVRRAVAVEAAGAGAATACRSPSASCRRRARSRCRSTRTRCRQAAELFAKRGMDAVIVAFLFSFLNNEHEQRAKEIVTVGPARRLRVLLLATWSTRSANTSASRAPR